MVDHRHEASKTEFGPRFGKQSRCHDAQNKSKDQMDPARDNPRGHGQPSNTVSVAVPVTAIAVIALAGGAISNKMRDSKSPTRTSHSAKAPYLPHAHGIARSPKLPGPRLLVVAAAAQVGALRAGGEGQAAARGKCGCRCGG